jgi:hypothetical protein
MSKNIFYFKELSFFFFQIYNFIINPVAQKSQHTPKHFDILDYGLIWTWYFDSTHNHDFHP